MRISFNSDALKIAGIGIVPWNRLGPEQWFPHYVIVSLYGWDAPDSADIPPLYALDQDDLEAQLPKLNTQSLVLSRQFQELANTQLQDYSFLVYKPVVLPTSLAGRKFLMANHGIAHDYENKVRFREAFAASLPFAPYNVYERSALPVSEDGFNLLLSGRDRIVLQDERLSGGRGTFIISAFSEYQAALRDLDLISKSDQVVLSSAIQNASDLSIQACVTQFGVVSGPLQRQIVRDPLLAGPDTIQGDKFCGVQICKEDQGSAAHHQASAVAQSVGLELQRLGYKGIFGIDFLLDPSDKLYILEVNPRITGATPLLTALYNGDNDIPFLLLHALELGDYDYTVEDTNTMPDAEGSLLVVHSLDSAIVIIDKLPSSGTYALSDGKLELRSRNVQMSELSDDEFIIFITVVARGIVKPGGRLATLLFPRPVIDIKTNKLYNDIELTILAVRQEIITKSS